MFTFAFFCLFLGVVIGIMLLMALAARDRAGGGDNERNARDNNRADDFDEK